MIKVGNHHCWYRLIRCEDLCFLLHLQWYLKVFKQSFKLLLRLWTNCRVYRWKVGGLFYQTDPSEYWFNLCWAILSVLNLMSFIDSNFQIFIFSGMWLQQSKGMVIGWLLGVILSNSSTTTCIWILKLPTKALHSGYSAKRFWQFGWQNL